MASKPPRIRPDQPRTYKIEFTSRALSELAGVPEKDRKRIGRKIGALANEPRPSGVEKLRGEEEYYRIRSGDYRVIYSISDGKLLVLVIRIGHRREVYRQLPR